MRLPIQTTTPVDGYIQKRLLNGETVGAGIPVILVSAGLLRLRCISFGRLYTPPISRSFTVLLIIIPGKIFPLELIGITPKLTPVSFIPCDSTLPVVRVSYLTGSRLCYYLYRMMELRRYLFLISSVQTDGRASVWFMI